MAVKPVLTVTGSLNKEKTQAQLQKQLNSIGKRLTLTIAYDPKQESSDKKRTNEKNKQEQAERRMAKLQMEAIRMDEKRTANIRAQANAQQQLIQNQQRSTQAQRDSIRNEQQKLDLMRRQSQLQASGLVGVRGVDQNALNSLRTNIAGAQNVGDLRGYNQQLRELGSTASGASTGIMGMASSMVHAMGKMILWTASGALLFGSLQKIGDAVQYITKMDTALSEIRMASSMTTAETSGLTDEYIRLGKELGISSAVIAKSAVDLYRQGLSTQQVNESMSDYIKLAKVMGEDLGRVIEMGTAGSITYGVSVEKLGSLAVAVGDSVASSGQEIMQIVQKSGSVAQMAGVSLEELSTIGAMVASTTRESGSQIGNSLITKIWGLVAQSIIENHF